jgi:hypothetical protein
MAFKLNKPVEPNAKKVVSFSSILLVIFELWHQKKNTSDYEFEAKSILNIVLQHDSGLFVVMFAHEQLMSLATSTATPKSTRLYLHHTRKYTVEHLMISFF